MASLTILPCMWPTGQTRGVTSSSSSQGLHGRGAKRRRAFAARGGVYLQWMVTGSVVITITDIALVGGPTATLSGIFFDPPSTSQFGSIPATATLVKRDTSTEGNWIGITVRRATTSSETLPAILHTRQFSPPGNRLAPGQPVPALRRLSRMPAVPAGSRRSGTLTTTAWSSM